MGDTRVTVEGGRLEWKRGRRLEWKREKEDGGD